LEELRDSGISKPELLAISPVYYVTNDNPRIPYTILKHGIHDDVIPVSESLNLETEVRSVGLECIVITLANSGHDFAGDPELNEVFLQKVIERMHLINL
jgi:dipeptidyl aminopeptidase/acylaminoacyl peptidase